MGPRGHDADYSGKKEILAEIRKALLYQYRCEIRYAPPHRDADTYQFDPYTLLFFKDSLYLGGYAHNRNGLRLFLVDRIQDISLSKERFEVPEGYGVDDLTGSSFGLVDDETMKIKVRFDAEISHLVSERTWHPHQKLTEQADGTLILEFEAGGTREILSWLFSFIPFVEVLQPESLRQSFVDALKKSLDKV